MYRTVDTSFWLDPKVRKWGKDTKLLALYLISNDQSHHSGMYFLRKTAAAEDLDLSPKDFDVSFKALQYHGFCLWDEENRVVWVKNMFDRQCHHGLHISRMINHLKTFKDSPLLAQFCERYSQHHQLVTKLSPLCHQVVTKAHHVEVPVEVPVEETVQEEEPPSGRKAPAPKTAEKIQKELDKINLEQFHDKYPYVDVDQMFESFSNRQIGALNPNGYSDFSRAFHNWCAPKQKEAEQKRSPGKVSVELEREKLRQRRTQGEAK